MTSVIILHDMYQISNSISDHSFNQIAFYTIDTCGGGVDL